jgi:hypothetical protein
MSRKPPDVVRQELTDSLEIAEREIGELTTFTLAWQSLATQLNKTLCDGTPSLVERVLGIPTFHPMQTTIPPNQYELFMGSKVEWSESGVVMSCFDEAKLPTPLSQWLDQIILVSDSQDLTIRDVIKYPRNKEAAHSDPNEHIKVETLKKAYMLRVGGQEYSSYHLTLATVGAYVIRRIRHLLSQT